MEYLTWSNIPHHILVEVLKHLPMNDRISSSLVCKWWSDVFDAPQLWDKFSFDLDTNKDPDGNSVTCVDKYGCVLKEIKIVVNQSQALSRERAKDHLS